nr:hypothetical protein CFP56_09857 [Quercus suber]
MCCHRLFIWETCGHHVTEANPIFRCQIAVNHQDHSSSRTCKPMTHPFKTFRFPTLCPTCAGERTEMMAELKHKQALDVLAWYTDLEHVRGDMTDVGHERIMCSKTSDGCALNGERDVENEARRVARNIRARRQRREVMSGELRQFILASRPH